MVRTLMDTVDKLVTNDEDKELEREHVKSALNANGYKPCVTEKQCSNIGNAI